MLRLIETIRLNNGIFNNVSYHEQRMKDSLYSLYNAEASIHLQSLLELQQFPANGLYKCRVIYDDKNCRIEFEAYTIRPVNSLKMVTDNDLSYSFKFQDRKGIDEIFNEREKCDDVLIIKNEQVTDSSYANILFKKGNDWITPSSYLLKGTMRQFLLDNNQIKIDEIQRKDIRKFDGFKLINAMLGFESREIDVSRIID
jgi:4-amino-4-deoxychorismate lyase